MKIAIEAQRLFRINKHGMDFVALELLRHLQKRNDGNEYHVIVAPGPDRCLLAEGNLSIIELSCPSYLLWEQVALPLAVKRLKPDLLHCTSNTAPLFCSVPLTLTLHDIIFLEPAKRRSPSFYQQAGRLYRRFVVPRILSRCKKVITVSHYEKERICLATGMPDKKVQVIYNACNTGFKPLVADACILNKYTPDTDFLFFLGNTDPKKNVENVLLAYGLYLQRSAEKRPLLVADMNHQQMKRVLQRLNVGHIAAHIYCSDYIPQTDLVHLYNAAYVFLYPSLRESFGIPILEAMACGTPVITSQTSAMSEVAGQEALTVNPYSPEDIAQALLHLETDAALYDRQKTYGLKRAHLFSWEKAADELRKAYAAAGTSIGS